MDKLTKIDELYRQTLEMKLDEMRGVYNDFIVRSRDKQFTTKYVWSIYLLAQAINNSGSLSKNIKQQFEAGFKLGFTMQEIVESIPETIRMYEHDSNLMQAKQQPKVDKYIYLWKKNKYGIPIGLKRIGICGTTTTTENLGSFWGLKNLDDITVEIAKMNALDQFVEFAKEQYIAHGGVNNEKEEKVNGFKEISPALRKSLETGNLNGFFTLIKSVFAQSPYYLTKSESDYHNIIHTILAMTGFDIHSELATNVGRIDTAFETERLIFIMEFKVDSNLGLRQIKQKKYFERYMFRGKKIILVGVNISSEKRNIVDWECEEYAAPQ